MRPIPKKKKDTMAADIFYSRCLRHGEGCSGRITWEHCWTYAGKQINELWAIIPLCWFHHLGNEFEKSLGQYFSLLLATPSDLRKYPKKDWRQEFNKLHKKYKDDYRTEKFKKWCDFCDKAYTEEV